MSVVHTNNDTPSRTLTVKLQGVAITCKKRLQVSGSQFALPTTLTHCALGVCRMCWLIGAFC